NELRVIDLHRDISGVDPAALGRIFVPLLDPQVACILNTRARAPGFTFYTRSQLNFALFPLPYTFSAPVPPTALGRMKIQFCHAERRPKMRVSIDSGCTNRRLASRPVSASGESATRDSMARRSSSAQSRSSGAAVTNPASSASSAE